MAKTTPVRWWRDDATRYQSRPLVVCREQSASLEIELIRPSPLTSELQQCLDDVQRRHEEYQREQAAAWAGMIEQTRHGGLNGGRDYEQEWHRRVFASLGTARQ